MFFGKDRRAIHRILIVEDEALVAFDNEVFLIHAGYQVVGTVDNHDAAAALIAAGGVDLVIADIAISGERDGIAVAALAHAHDVAVLFVTGHCPSQAEHLALGRLAKPYTQRDLLGAIQAADAILRNTKPRRIPAGLNLFRKTLDDNAA